MIASLFIFAGWRVYERYDWTGMTFLANLLMVMEATTAVWLGRNLEVGHNTYPATAIFTYACVASVWVALLGGVAQYARRILYGGGKKRKVRAAKNKGE
jgi:hypothetical protein